MSSIPLRIGVLASGSGTNLQSIIDFCEEEKIHAEVVCVVSDNADAKALLRAEKHDIDAVHVPFDFKKRKQCDDQITSHFVDRDVGLVVGAGYMRLLCDDFVSFWKGRLINIHPALLPSFKGVDAHGDALSYGVKITGCTTHFIDEEMDHGPIILQAAVPIFEEDDKESLAKRVLQAEHQILPRTIDLFEKKRLSIVNRRVHIKADDDSWTKRFPVLSDVLYSEGY